MPYERDWLSVVAEGSCEECGLRACDIPRGAVAPALQNAALDWVALLTGADVDHLRARVAPGRWSALEYACHSADVLGLFTQRIERALLVEDPEFEWWDHEAAARDERYNDRAPADVVALLAGNTARIATRLETLSDRDWLRAGTRRAGERFTVEGLACFALHEVHHHYHDARVVIMLAGGPAGSTAVATPSLGTPDRSGS